MAGSNLPVGVDSPLNGSNRRLTDGATADAGRASESAGLLHR